MGAFLISNFMIQLLVFKTPKTKFKLINWRFNAIVSAILNAKKVVF